MQWRIQFEGTSGNVKPMKPFYATTQPIELRPGKPVRVAWLA